MSDSGSQPRPAYCEEYSEEAQTTVPETKQSANIAAKRSKPDIGKPKAIRDEFSDSGYSTTTLGSSLNSKLEIAQSNALRTPAANHETPTAEQNLSQSRAHSPEKTSSRKSGSRSRKGGDARKKDCRCDKCVAAARRASAPKDSHRQPTHVLVQPLQRTSGPSSPQSRRAPTPPDALPTREHVRPRGATASRARPTSFHATTMPEPIFIAQPGTQPLFIERQPASRHSTIYPFPPPSYPPQQPSYFLTSQPPPPPPPQEFYSPMPYEVQPQPQLRPRPRPRQWTSDHHPSRPQSMYYGSPPILEFAEPIFKTIEPTPPPLERQLSRRGRRTSLREGPPAPAEDYGKMLPPPPPRQGAEPTSRHGQRPPIRHAATTSVAYPELRHRGSGNDSTEGQISNRKSRKPSLDEARSGRPSLSRPTGASDEKMVSFDEIERGTNRMKIESGNTKSRRHSSVYGHESLEQLEGSVEAYQESRGTIRSPTFTPTHDEMVRLTRKKTNVSSDTGSRASGHSKGSRGSRGSSDAKPRRSLDRRPSNDVNARSENDRFALRFNPEGINVKMQGSIEGRAINLRKSKDGDGDMELSIESRANIETRGRTVGSRPTLREKSRKRYSYIEGQGVRELENTHPVSSRTPSRPGMDRRDEDERRIIGERIITTTRSRRSSRYGYDGII